MSGGESFCSDLLIGDQDAKKGGVCVKHGANKGKDKAAKRKRAREESDDEDGDEHIVRVVAEAQKITRNERATRRRK